MGYFKRMLPMVTDRVDLIQAVERLRRSMPRNPDVEMVYQAIMSAGPIADVEQHAVGIRPKRKRDRAAYMRAYRAKRAAS